MRPKQLCDKAQELVVLIDNGRLFALQEMLKAGGTRDLVSEEWGALAEQAVRCGFHSMMEVLLTCRIWLPEELAGALAETLESCRDDLTDLLLASGASVSEVDFGDLCKTMNASVIGRFLRLGIDPAHENGFAWALNRHKAKPLLGVYRSLRKEFPVLDQQAALALSEAVNNENLRWVCLLRWAGADPFMPVP